MTSISAARRIGTLVLGTAALTLLTAACGGTATESAGGIPSSPAATSGPAFTSGPASTSSGTSPNTSSNTSPTTTPTTTPATST